MFGYRLDLNEPLNTRIWSLVEYDIVAFSSWYKMKGKISTDTDIDWMLGTGAFHYKLRLMYVFSN